MNAGEFLGWLRGGTRDGRWSGKTLIMGVLNVTPDSFSDGGKFSDPSAALEHAYALVAAGADLIDIGGESTRPGAQRIDSAEQLRRIAPVISTLAKQSSVTISVDTTRAAVAEAVLDAGANLVNDISGGRDDPAMLPLVARRKVPIVLMHMQGAPATMQIKPTYRNVVSEIDAFLRQMLQQANTIGINPADVLLDPGIGFGKTTEHNLQILKDLPTLAAIGRPLVVGVSRKGFISRLVADPPGGDVTAEDRLFGTAAAVAWSAANGAAIVRVHDVGPMSRIVRMIQAIGDAPPAI